MEATALLLILVSRTINDCYAFVDRVQTGLPDELGSHKSIPESFPYIVSIGYLLGKPFCVGTLISNEFVLTAANCINRPSKMLLYLGSRDPRKYSEEGRVVKTVDIKDTKVFTNTSDGTQRSGIGLIKLPEAVSTAQISPIRLVQRSLPLENMTTLLGYGWTYPRSEVITRGHGSVVPDENCRRVYGFYYRPEEFCISGRRNIACQGFSGSPLVVRDRNGTMRLVAIAAYQYQNDCTADIPVLYARIESYLDWIKKNTGVEIEE